MLIYNITMQIGWTIQPQWLPWIKDIYASQVMESGCFANYQLVRLLDIDEDEGPTYALQLYTKNREKYIEYVQAFQPQLEVIAFEKWGSGMLIFGTLMEIVE